MNDARSGAATILLICREGDSRQKYQAGLCAPGVLLLNVNTLMQFFCREVYCPLNGILIDMPTYMRSSDREKLLLAELVELFPALRIKCNESSNEIRSLPFGTVCPGNITPTDFIQNICVSFVPRKIRTGERSTHHLPVLMHPASLGESSSGSLSVTANISHGGCFLISFESWSVGDLGWLVIPALAGSEPISVVVCWVSVWGEIGSIPGIGLRFLNPTAAQKAELSRLGGKSFMLDDK